MNATSEPTVSTPSILPAPPRRRRWLTVLLIAVLFVTGTISGAGGAAIFIRARVQDAVAHPEIGRARAEGMLVRRLDLDPQQRRQVGRILRERQRAMLAIRREVYPRMMRELEQSNEEIARVLRPDQRAKWNETYQTLRSRWLPQPPPPAQEESK